jgi:hypothetical protein
MTVLAVRCADCQSIAESSRLKLDTRTKTEHGSTRDTGDNQSRRDKSCNRKRCITYGTEQTHQSKGGNRDEIGTEQLVLYWLAVKRVLRERREREAKARAKRRRQQP